MTTTWTPLLKHPINYLLKEDSGYLLLETGDKIILEQTGTSTSMWNYQTKH